jgi:hypothetical protein
MLAKAPWKSFLWGLFLSMAASGAAVDRTFVIVRGMDVLRKGLSISTQTRWFMKFGLHIEQFH